jgi:hypothetical protein
MNNEDILRLVRRDKRFSVSWRWRDNGLRYQCDGLVRQGVLKKDLRCGPGRDVYTIGHEDMIERYLRNRAQKKERLTKKSTV